MNIETLELGNSIRTELALLDGFLKTMKNIEVNSPNANPNISVYSHQVPSCVDRKQILAIITKAVEMEEKRLQHRLLLL